MPQLKSRLSNLKNTGQYLNEVNTPEIAEVEESDTWGMLEGYSEAITRGLNFASYNTIEGTVAEKVYTELDEDLKSGPILTPTEIKKAYGIEVDKEMPTGVAQVYAEMAQEKAQAGEEFSEVLDLGSPIRSTIGLATMMGALSITPVAVGATWALTAVGGPLGAMLGAGGSFIKGGIKASKLLKALNKSKAAQQVSKVAVNPQAAKLGRIAGKEGKRLREAIKNNKSLRVAAKVTATAGTANALEELAIASVEASKGNKYDPTMTTALAFVAPAVLVSAGRAVAGVSRFTKNKFSRNEGDIRYMLEDAVKTREAKIVDAVDELRAEVEKPEALIDENPDDITRPVLRGEKTDEEIFRDVRAEDDPEGIQAGVDYDESRSFLSYRYGVDKVDAEIKKAIAEEQSVRPFVPGEGKDLYDIVKDKSPVFGGKRAAEEHLRYVAELKGVDEIDVTLKDLIDTPAARESSPTVKEEAPTVKEEAPAVKEEAPANARPTPKIDIDNTKTSKQRDAINVIRERLGDEDVDRALAFLVASKNLPAGPIDYSKIAAWLKNPWAANKHLSQVVYVMGRENITVRDMFELSSAEINRRANRWKFPDHKPKVKKVDVGDTPFTPGYRRTRRPSGGTKPNDGAKAVSKIVDEVRDLDELADVTRANYDMKDPVVRAEVEGMESINYLKRIFGPDEVDRSLLKLAESFLESGINLRLKELHPALKSTDATVKHLIATARELGVKNDEVSFDDFMRIKESDFDDYVKNNLIKEPQPPKRNAEQEFAESSVVELKDKIEEFKASSDPTINAVGRAADDMDSAIDDYVNCVIGAAVGED